MNQSTIFEHMIPDTGWRPPAEFPSLADAKSIAVDVETYDPDLFTKGPGVRTNGYIVGVSVGTDDGWRGYFPVRHSLGGNMDSGRVFAWLKEELSRDNQPKIGANILYDLDYLAQAGIEVKGKLIDVLLAYRLLDEHRRSNSLEACAQELLGEGKQGDALWEWSANAYKGKPTRRDQIKHIWQAPPQLVGPYAESDVDLPIRLIEPLTKRLTAEELETSWNLENRLLPTMLKMKRRGIRVDLEGAEMAEDILTGEAGEAQAELDDMVGGTVNVNAGIDLAEVYKARGITVPKTGFGAPSITAGWLESQDDDVSRAVLTIRRLEKLNGTFIKGAILDHQINGRVHCEFPQLVARTRRFVSQNPNLQQIPARDPRAKELLRGLFIPEEDHDLVAADYSQIEYRLICHYATGEGAEEARQMYRDNPSTDFHQMVADWLGMPRNTTVKNTNFSKAYRAGVPTFARTAGLTIDRAREIYDLYDEKLPFVKCTAERVDKEAAKQGWLRTLLGGKSRFPFWESRNWDTARTDGKMSHDAAIEKYGSNNIRRAGTYKGLNSLIQPSAAEVLKEAMAQLDEAGITDVLPLHLTVHDELVVSKPRTPAGEDAAKEMQHIMENIAAARLSVPLKVDMEIGTNWGNVK